MAYRRKIMPGIDKDKFIESIYHVVYFGNLLSALKSTLNSTSSKINKKESAVVRLSIQWNVMLMAVSFQDELNKYLLKYKPTEENLMIALESYKNIIDPAIKKLNSWKELRTFRNHVLAHNFRIDSKDFSSVFFSNQLKLYKIPKTLGELFSILKFLDIISTVTKEIFNVEYEEACHIIDSLQRTIKVGRNKAIEDEFQDCNSIILEINKRIAKHNLMDA